MHKTEGGESGHVAEAVQLTAGNFAELARGLPARARMVLSAAMNLERGSLKVTLPDLRRILVVGKAPGPNAEVTLNNWKLPARAFSGGTIGVAESYMDGDWDSPDVTSFLELFVVNVEAGETVAGTSSWIMAVIHRIHHWLNREHPQGLAQEHLRPLRSRQRLLQGMARPDDDLFLGAVFDRRQRPGKRADRQVPGACPRSRHRRRPTMCWRSAAAGAALPNSPRARSAAGSPA